MKKAIKNIYIVLLISAIFVAGFLVGQKYLNPPKPAPALAQSSQPAKIHNLRFKKLVYQHLRKFTVSKAGKEYGISDKKIQTIMNKLEKDDYFTSRNKKSDRISYIDNFLIPGKYQSELRVLLKNSFEELNNYEYYSGNLTNRNSQMGWNDVIDLLIDKNNFSSSFTWDDPDSPYLFDLILDRSLLFENSGPSSVFQTKCQDLKTPGCLTAFIMDINSVPKLKNPNRITTTAWYELGYKRANSSIEPPEQWSVKDAAYLSHIPDLNNQVAQYLQNGTGNSAEAKDIQSFLSAAQKILGTSGRINNDHQGKEFGLGISKPLKLTNYQYNENNISVTFNSDDLAYIISGCIAEDGVGAEASHLRGSPLHKSITTIKSIFNKVEKYYNQEVFNSYKFHVNNFIITIGDFDIVAGAINKEKKKIWFETYPVQIAAQDNAPYGYQIISHEAMHAGQPEILNHGQEIAETFLGESYHDFMTKRFLDLNDYPYEETPAYRGDVFETLKLKLVEKRGTIEAVNNFLDNAYRQSTLDLDHIFGNGFTDKFLPLFDAAVTKKSLVNSLNKSDCPPHQLEEAIGKLAITEIDLTTAINKWEIK